MSDVKKIELSEPIKGFDGSEINEIALKPVDSAMYLKIGDLSRAEVRTNGNVETIFVDTNVDRLNAYLAECSGLPKPILMQMPLVDIRKCKQVIEGFFQD